MERTLTIRSSINVNKIQHYRFIVIKLVYITTIGHHLVCLFHHSRAYWFLPSK
ncbi:hypothetical protein Hanom_Chr09g00825651 [Helianthus anomalus]